MSDMYIHMYCATNRARLSSSTFILKQAANLSVSIVVVGSHYFYILMILLAASQTKRTTTHHSSSNQSIKQSPLLFILHLYTCVAFCSLHKSMDYSPPVYIFIFIIYTKQIAVSLLHNHLYITITIFDD